MTPAARLRTDEPIYRVNQALMDTAALPDLSPTRFFAVLLPLWYVELTGTVYEAETYELIEQYVERAIQAAEIRSTTAIARFLGLDGGLVERVVEFLRAIDHVTGPATELRLTATRARSVETGVRWIPKHGRQRLYFDGYACIPLHSAHYGPDVKILSEAEALTLGRPHGIRFRPLFGGAPLDAWEAVWQLVARPDRAEFNLPDEIRDERPGPVGRAYLPAYLIEAAPRTGKARPGSSLRRYLAYTAIATRRDELVERVCNDQPAVRAALDAEASPDPTPVWMDWLAKNGLERIVPVRQPNGSWRATLPAVAFGEHAKFTHIRVGSFEIRAQDGLLLEIWCDDQRIRREAAAQHAMAALSRCARRRATDASLTAGESRAELTAELGRIARRLMAPQPGLDELRRRAAGEGRIGLVRFVNELGEGGGIP